MKQKFDIIIDEKGSDHAAKTKKNSESNNHTLAVDEIRDSLPPVVVNDDSQDNNVHRLDPAALFSAEMGAETNLRNMLEKSLLNQEISI